MIRKYSKTIGFAGLILLAAWVFGNRITKTLADSGDGFAYLQRFFLYTDGTEKISFDACLSYFTVVILTLFSFLSAETRCQRTYRSLVLHRYRSKRAFLGHMIWSGYAHTAAATLWLALCVFAAPVVRHMRNVPPGEMKTVVLLLVNLFLYFNCCVLLRLYLSFRLHDVHALAFTAFFTVILLYLDTKMLRISVLTLGGLPDTLHGALALLLVYGLLLLTLRHFLRRKDVL